MSATDTLGHWCTVCGLPATDPHLRLQIRVRTMPKVVGVIASVG